MNETFNATQYDMPAKPGNYMKFQQGVNHFRILSNPIKGWEWWVRADGTVKTKNDKSLPGDKPVRAMTQDEGGMVPMDAQEVARSFMAWVVYNYDLKAVQILEVTQKGIATTLRGLVASKAWGDPKEYDLTVTKEGEGLDTEYSLLPESKEPTDPKILAEYKAKNIDLTALFRGEDPFAQSKQVDVDEAIAEIDESGKPVFTD